MPARLRFFAIELAKRLRPFEVEAICGPLVEGAFVGLLVAAELNVPFFYSERMRRKTRRELFPIGYALPEVFHSSIRQRRVAIVNDVINAGSSVRGTFETLVHAGAELVAIGALLVLGTSAESYAMSKNVPLETLAALPNAIWSLTECPLCRAGIPLQDQGGFAAELGE